MARGFDLHPNDKVGSGERLRRQAAIPFDRGPRGINDIRPIDSREEESEVWYPGFWPQSLAGAGPLFLLAVAFLCTLYPGLKNKHSIAANIKPDAQLRSDATSQPYSATPPLAERSPIPSAVASRSEGSVMPERPSHAVSSLPRVLAVHDHTLKYQATHKKAFGKCTGQLELTNAALHFRCSHQADLDIRVSSIARAHKDGVVLESGEKYHFLIANHTKGQVEMIFNLWLNRARQFQQASRESSF